MSLWSRIANVLRSDPLTREIDEELASHIEEAIERGRDRAEARRTFDSTLRQRKRAATSGSSRGSIRFARTPSSAGASL
jgi:hypothetical protein